MAAREISDDELEESISKDPFHVGMEAARSSGLVFDTTSNSSVFDLIADFEERSGVRHVEERPSVVRATFRPGSTRPTKVEREE